MIQEDKTKKELLENLPLEVSSLLQNFSFSDLREIRLREGKCTMLYYGEETKKVGKIMDAYEIQKIFEAICKNSVYAYLNEICEGFITLSGGHRVGMCGECELQNGNISNIHSFCGINIRIAREFKGCARKLMPYITNGNEIKNTLLISPPACGKTTMLRDIARIISENKKVTVIDERKELGATHHGMPQFDLGPQTDIFSKSPKNLGMIMALRALSPDVIITDEVGTKEDITAMEQVLGAGCKIITSIHGYSAESIKNSKENLLLLFDVLIELKKENGTPEISKIINTKGLYL